MSARGSNQPGGARTSCTKRATNPIEVALACERDSDLAGAERAFRRGSTRGDPAAVTLAVIAILITLLVGGESNANPNAAVPDATRVTGADINRQKAPAARAFLEYWRAVQKPQVAGGMTYIAPFLADGIGASRLRKALDRQAGYFRSAKPRIKGVTRQGRLRRVDYKILTPYGDLVPVEVGLVRLFDGWKIVFDPLLNQVLRSTAIEDFGEGVQAFGPTKEALRAGDRAAGLQQKFYESSAARKNLARIFANRSSASR